MATVYLNIGSNIGDRRALIERAVALISNRWPDATIRLSEWIESPPWGYESDRTFLNLGVAMDMDYLPDAISLLDSLQHIEKTVGSTPHRNADGSYRDREIDIDIIAIDRMTIDHPRLTIPHPRAAARDFVMDQLKQLADPETVAFVAGTKR